MSHEEMLYALQLIGDERSGKSQRARARAEDAQAAKNTQNLARATNARSTR